MMAFNPIGQRARLQSGDAQGPAVIKVQSWVLTALAGQRECDRRCLRAIRNRGSGAGTLSAVSRSMFGPGLQSAPFCRLCGHRGTL